MRSPYDIWKTGHPKLISELSEVDKNRILKYLNIVYGAYYNTGYPTLEGWMLAASETGKLNWLR